MAVSKTPRAVPEQLKGLPLFLSIDDTMVEKESEKFELHSRLFDHTAHNGLKCYNKVVTEVANEI